MLSFSFPGVYETGKSKSVARLKKIIKMLEFAKIRAICHNCCTLYYIKIAKL